MEAEGGLCPNFPYKWRNLLLTVLSYLFYGWWKPWFIALMLDHYTPAPEGDGIQPLIDSGPRWRAVDQANNDSSADAEQDKIRAPLVSGEKIRFAISGPLGTPR